MDCDCSRIELDFCGDEGKLLFNKVMKSARKQYVCCSCKEIINKNSSFELSITIVSDEKKMVSFVCIDCYTLREEFYSNLFFDDIKEAVWEYVCGGMGKDGSFSEDCISSIKIPSARSKLCDMIELLWDIRGLNN